MPIVIKAKIELQLTPSRVARSLLKLRELQKISKLQELQS